MLLGGLQKTTLIDFPGRVACTVFTVGCNFRCPFCHNKDLVTVKNFKKAKLKQISEDYFFQFLKKRKKILDGVCITGGEPTMQKDLPEFCKKIKDLGLEVKVDTNGSNPEMLERLTDDGVVDYIAMDIKGPLDEMYLKIAGLVTNRRLGNTEARKIRRHGVLNLVKRSIGIILKSGLEYEFRTTVVPGLHDKKTMIELARDLKKIVKLSQPKAGRPRAENCQTLPTGRQVVKLNYVLQFFRPQNCLDPKYLKIEPYNDDQLRDILRGVREVLPKTGLRSSD